MATPTFLLTPSGYKAGTLYAPLPADGDGDMEMTRSAIATRVNQNGIIQDSAVDVPRIDYLYGGCPSCIFEEATTNLIDESEDFSSWISVDADLTTGIIAPDGNTSATTLQGDGTGTQPGIIKLVNLPSSGRFSTSFFAKAKTNNYVRLNLTGYDTTENAFFDLSNGNSSGLSAGWVDVGTEYYGNGWYRCFGTYETITDLSGAVRIYGAPNMTTISFPSNAAAATASIDIFGAQVEMQDRPHSYVKTTGSVVSSAADRYRLTNIGQFFGTNTGAFYAEFADYPFRYESGNVNFLQMYDQSTNDYIRFRGSSISFLGPQMVGGWSSGTATYSTEPVVSSIRKVAFTWDGSDWKAKVNGQSEQTGAVTANFNPTILGTSGGGYWTSTSLVRLKTLAFYDRKLTSNELDELTTL